MAPATAEAPIPPELTNAITVSDCQKPETDWTVCVDLIVWLVSVAVASAVQISDVPKRVLARATRVQVSPAPLTVTVCAGAKFRPSDATKATRRRFGPTVEKTRLRTPWPVEFAVRSIVSARGPAETTM